MSRIKTLNCNHAYLRAAERCGWDEIKARKMMKLAQKEGKLYYDIEDEKLKKFLKARQINTVRRIKYYEGYVFVFASTSTRCYTVYPYEEKKEINKNDTKEI